MSWQKNEPRLGEILGQMAIHGFICWGYLSISLFYGVGWPLANSLAVAAIGATICGILIVPAIMINVMATIALVAIGIVKLLMIAAP